MLYLYVWTYLIAGLFTLFVCDAELEMQNWQPRDTRLAISTTSAMLWPLAWFALFGWFVVRASRTLVRSFVALWREVRGSRLPRATARTRAP